ncbi:conserved hypothetical protein [Gammaproteobacteria bacterium]
MSVLGYTSVNEIIAKILSDSDIKNEKIRITDIITWCGEALRKIGGSQAVQNIITGKDNVPLLQITNYKTVLPCNCIRIEQLGVSISETGPFQKTRLSTGSFDKKRDTSNIGEQITGDDITYYIAYPYIHINFKDGYGLLSYQAVPTDDDGYPLIPDLEAVKEALYWYCETKILYALYRSGKIRDSVYINAKKEWARCCNNAYNTIQMPTSSDEMETIMNVWVRLIPNLGGHDTSYKYIGQKEEFYRHD